MVYSGRQLVANAAMAARCSVAVCRASVFLVPDVQCPHPWSCYGRTCIEDTAENFAIGQHVIIVVLPFAEGTRPVPVSG
jgi:hypothetical protein